MNNLFIILIIFGVKIWGINNVRKILRLNVIKVRYFFVMLIYIILVEKDNLKYFILNFGLRGYWYFCVF